MMILGSVLTWYYSGKWVDHIVQLPTGLAFLTKRIQDFFYEYVQGEARTSYDIEAASKTAAKDVMRLRHKITRFDNFIQEHPALKAVVEAHSIKHGHKIVWMNVEQSVPTPSETIFERWRKTQSEKVDLEFMWEERLSFVKRHPPVMKCMLEHIQAIKNGRRSLEYGGFAP